MKGLLVFLKTCFYAAQVIVTAGFLYLLFMNSQINSPGTFNQVKSVIQNCPTCKVSADALSMAYQLGRLDYVTLSLTILGVVLAVFGFAGFWMIRKEALDIAESSCKAVVNEMTPTEVGKYLASKPGTEKLRELLGPALEKTLQDDAFVAKIVEKVLPEVQASSRSAEDLADTIDSEIDTGMIDRLIRDLDDDDIEPY